MFKDKPLAELKVRVKSTWIFDNISRIARVHTQGTPQFRAHASKILNSFNYIIDALDKDPDMKEIAKMVAEGKINN